MCWERDLNISKGGASEFGGGCSADGLDAILHRAPKHYYPDIAERGLAMVWIGLGRIVALHYCRRIHLIVNTIFTKIIGSFFLKRQCDRTLGLESDWRDDQGDGRGAISPGH